MGKASSSRASTNHPAWHHSLCGVCTIVTLLSCACGRTEKNKAAAPDPGSNNAGSRSASSSNVTSGVDAGSSTTTGGPEASPEDWTFGDDLTSVVSSPVSDTSGNLYVVIGTRNEAKTTPELPAGVGSPANIQTAQVVSLTADGKERWRSDPICNSAIQTEEYAAIAVSGSMVYALCGTLAKLTTAGDSVWSARSMYGHGIAVTDNDTVIARRAQALLAYTAIASDGSERWTATVGVQLDEAISTRTGPHTSPIVSDGKIFSPCDTCAPDAGGVGVLDSATGATSSVISLSGMPREYGSMAATANGDIFILSQDLHTLHQAAVQATPAGTISRTVLADEDGPVYLVTGPGTSRQLRWGETRLSNLPPDPVGVLHEPVALIEPDIVLLNSGVALKRDGEEAFSVPDASLVNLLVLPRNGNLVYVTKDQRLVARSFDISGFAAAAPWPSPSGNAQGNHRVE